MKKEIIEKWIQEAYAINKANGFHDPEHQHSNTCRLMLIVTEISEAVEADRKGIHPRELNIFEEACRTWDGNKLWETMGYAQTFHDHIKDSFEDELSDVVIRCCDFLGCLGMTFEQAFKKPWEPINHQNYDTFADEAWYWVWLLCGNDHATNVTAAANVAGLLLQVCDYCDINDIDIAQHVEWKLKYNKTRPFRHGKAY